MKLLGAYTFIVVALGVWGILGNTRAKISTRAWALVVFIPALAYIALTVLH